MRMRLLLIALFLLASAGTAAAEEVREVTLAEAVEIAHKESDVWSQFDAREKSAKAQVKAAQSHWWPILSADSALLFWSDESKIDVYNKDEVHDTFDKAADAALNELKVSDTGKALLDELATPLKPAVNAFTDTLLGAIPQSISLKDNFNFEFGLTLMMPLTPLFKVYQGQKLAELGLENIDVERRGKALQISYEVTDVYLKLVYAQLMTGVAEEALGTLKEHVALAQKYESVGLISHSDVLFAQVEELKMQQQLVEARNNTKLAGLKLAQVLSQPRGTIYHASEMPSETFDIVLEPLENYQDQAAKNRTELQRVDIGAEAAQRKRNMALLDYIPQIALVGRYQYSYGLDVLKPRNQAFIGLGMTWTIFDGGGHYYEAEMAAQSNAEMTSKSDEARELIELEVAQKYLSLQTALEHIKLTNEAEALANENLRTVTARFKEGESLSTDVLTAETKHAAARADQVKARIDILIAYAGLLLSIGEAPTIDVSSLH